MTTSSLRFPSVHELAEGDDLAEVVRGVCGEADERVRHRVAGVGLVLQALGRLGPPQRLLYPRQELRDERVPLLPARGRCVGVDATLLPLLVERLVAVD